MKYEPWHPAKYDADIALAFKSLASGTASDRQQKIALAWLIKDCCGTYDETFFADSDRNSTFAQGKRYVGLQVVKMVNLPSEALSKPKPPRKRVLKPQSESIDG